MNCTKDRFRTPVGVGSPLRHIGIKDKNLFLGSCFAEHVGGRFAEACLQTMVNPLGVMYNPLSIARLLTTQVSEPERDFVLYKGMWHTWLGDSSLSRLDADECRQATDEALASLHTEIKRADNLFLTLGTSRYYIYKETYEIAANCHRLPAIEFEEYDLSIDEIVEALETALVPLHVSNPQMQVIFTVSPYRYSKYGMHESQLAKARLLLAVDKLQELHPEWISYFPAYELLLDDLRDYRFYEEDMLHPSDQAVDYIWQRLSDEWMSDEVRSYLARWEPIRRSLAHRPLHPESPEYASFRENTQAQLDKLKNDYPHLSFPSV